MGALKAVELIGSLNEQDTVGDLRHALDEYGEAGVDPEELYDLERKEPCRVQLHWLAPGADGVFDALIRGGEPGRAVADDADALHTRARSATQKPWAAYASDPLQGVAPQLLVPELRRFARAALPEYMVPSAFVLLDVLPLTPSGKLDHAALPPPDRSRPERKTVDVAARTRTERVLSVIWGQLLGLDRVGVHDNFFELGGHSLLAIRVLSRVREAFAVEVPVHVIFEAPTIAGLAQLVEDARARGERDETPGIARLSREAYAATMLPGGVLDVGDLLKRRGTGPPPAGVGS